MSKNLKVVCIIQYSFQYLFEIFVLHLLCISIVFVLYFYCFSLYLSGICFVFLLYLYGDCSRVYTAHPPPFLEVAEPGSLPHKPRSTWDNQTLSSPCLSHHSLHALLQAPQTKL